MEMWACQWNMIVNKRLQNQLKQRISFNETKEKPLTWLYSSLGNVFFYLNGPEETH